MSVGSFYDDTAANLVYVRTFLDDNPNNHTMEISQRTYGIYGAGGENDIHLQNLQIADAHTIDVYFNGSTFVTIASTSAINAFEDGIRFDVTSSSTVVSSTAAWNGSNGIAVDDAPGFVINGDVAYDNSSLTNRNYTAGIKVNGDYAPYASSSNVTIENSASYSNGVSSSIPDEYIGSGIWADTIGNGLSVHNNTVYGNQGPGMNVDADNDSSVYDNVVYDNNGGIAAYADAQPTMTGHVIYNNTVYGNRGSGIEIAGPSAGSSLGGCTNNSVANNIAMDTIGGPNLAVFNGCENPGMDGSGNTYTYNEFGLSSSDFIEWGASTYYSSYAPWEATYCASTGCSHSIESDPQFVSTPTDNFALLASSPAISAGINLGASYSFALDPASTWPNSIILDNENNYGSGWDIGAYEYTQTSTPSIAWVSPSNGSTVSSTVTLSASSSAVSPAAISSLQFFLDGSLLGTASQTSSPFTNTWNTTGVSNASHTLYAFATDNDGNTASSSVITVNNATTPPVYTGPVIDVASGYGIPNYEISTPSTTPTVSSTQTAPSSASIQALINSLTAQLQRLLLQAGETGGTPSTTGSDIFVFTRDLQLHDTGNDVRMLQELLNSQGVLVSQSGAGSSGHETIYFGAKTWDALVRFQTSVDIKPASGYLGPITRAYVNKLLQ